MEEYLLMILANQYTMLQLLSSLIQTRKGREEMFDFSRERYKEIMNELERLTKLNE